MSILEVHDVSIRYMTGDFKDIGLKEYVVRKLKGNYHVNEFWADRHITFTLEKGDMLGIIGTNGAGKSTLLKAVSGIMEPTGGYVKREGNIAALLELASGFDGDLTVRENAYLRGAMLGYTRWFMDEKYDEIIKFAELQDFQDRPFKQLSSGMKSRLAFSIASLVAPDILILDEVLSVGDGAFRKKSEEKMREIIAGGATTILVSHSIQQVRALCNKVLWIEKGRQIAFGDAESLCDLYQQYLNHSISLEQAQKILADRRQNEVSVPASDMVDDGLKGTPVSLKGEAAQAASVKTQSCHAKPEISLLQDSKSKRIWKFIGVYTLLFLAAFILTYSPFFEAGKSFIWEGDAREQHYPAMIYVGRYLRQVVLHLFHGEIALPLFDLNLAVGGDIISTLNYYGFGDPLYLLAGLIPTVYTEYLYNFIVILHLFLAGLSFSALCAYHKKPSANILVGAIIYAFSGYAVFLGVRHVFFINAMVQLPLLLIGIDLIIQKRDPLFFILSVFYSALCGFYFLYMMTLMLGVYTLVRFFSLYTKGGIKEFFWMAGRIIGAYLTGLGLSAPLFLPSVLGFLSSSRSGQAVTRNFVSYGWSYYRDNLLRVIAPIGSDNAFTVAAIVIPALVLLLFFRRGKNRDLKWLLGLAVLVYVFPLGGHIMNGFSYPVQRWTFAVSLLLAYTVVEMLPDLLSMNKLRQFFCFLSLVAYSVCVFLGGKNRSVYYVVGVAMLAATLLVLSMLTDYAAGKKAQRFGAVACAVLAVFNVGVNGIYEFAKDQGKYINTYSEYGKETQTVMDRVERKAEALAVQKQGRFDSKSFFRNAGAVWRVPTLYFYWSIVNSSVVDFWDQTENIGIGYTKFHISGADERTISDALLSVKYYIGKDKERQYMPHGYAFSEEASDGFCIYKNQYALPWGYTYDSYMTYEDLDGMSNGLFREEAMLQSIAVDKNIPGMEKKTVDSRIQGIPYKIIKLDNLDWSDGILKVEKSNAVMTLECQMPAGAEVYLRLQGLNTNGSGKDTFFVKAQCADVNKSARTWSSNTNWYYGRENYLFNLGYSEEKRAGCTITFPEKGTYQLKDIQLFALPMDKYPGQIETLREEPLENIEFGTNRIAGTVDVSKSKILCMSIPYSKGWKARVDGEETEILKGNYMFMALPLTEGQHSIEFVYCTPGLKIGIGCSMVSIIAVVLLRKKYKQHSDEGQTKDGY